MSSQGVIGRRGEAVGGERSERQKSDLWGPDGHIKDFALHFKNNQKLVKMSVNMRKQRKELSGCSVGPRLECGTLTRLQEQASPFKPFSTWDPCPG